MEYATAPLSRWGRLHLWGMLVLIAAFGAVVEMRSAFLTRRMSDLTVFIRAGWAVRSGENIYQVSDERNGWYYVYPPFFAILMAPLAESPPGHDRSWMIPYPITVAFWYVFNIAMLVWSVNKLAGALEQASPDRALRAQPAFCRRWWALRVVPIYACMIPIGSTLSHGQTNLVILAMLAGMFAAILQKKPFQAGLWMAGPVCMKVFPAFLLIYPLWRRDTRCLTGCAAGLLVGLGLLPAVVFGPERTVAYYQEFADLVLLPGLGKGDNQARADTLTDLKATDTQSFMAMIHNAMHLDVYTRPANPSAAVRSIHWGLGAGLTLLVCLTAGWRRPSNPMAEVLFLGLLVMVMMFTSPVCHLPYFAWLLPIVMVLLILRWENRRTLAVGTGIATLIVLHIAIHVLAHMANYPLFAAFRDLGLATYVGLALGAVALLDLRKQTQPSLTETPEVILDQRAAA